MHADTTQRRILDVIRAIPEGFVRTYADVSPGADLRRRLARRAPTRRPHPQDGARPGPAVVAGRARRWLACRRRASARTLGGRGSSLLVGSHRARRSACRAHAATVRRHKRLTTPSTDTKGRATLVSASADERASRLAHPGARSGRGPRVPIDRAQTSASSWECESRQRLPPYDRCSSEAGTWTFRAA